MLCIVRIAENFATDENRAQAFANAGVLPILLETARASTVGR